MTCDAMKLKKWLQAENFTQHHNVCVFDLLNWQLLNVLPERGNSLIVADAQNIHSFSKPKSVFFGEAELTHSFIMIKTLILRISLITMYDLWLNSCGGEVWPCCFHSSCGVVVLPFCGKFPTCPVPWLKSKDIIFISYTSDSDNWHSTVFFS